MRTCPPFRRASTRLCSTSNTMAPGSRREARGCCGRTARRSARCRSRKRSPSSCRCETFDIGDDTRTGVNALDYKLPFPFDGAIDKLTYRLGPTQLTGEEHLRMQYAIAVAND